MLAWHNAFGRIQNTFNSVCVRACFTINKADRVIDRKVRISMLIQARISAPAVALNCSARRNVMLYDWQQIRSATLRYWHHKTAARLLFVTAEHPNSFDSMTAIEFALAKFRFVDLNLNTQNELKTYQSAKKNKINT